MLFLQKMTMKSRFHNVAGLIDALMVLVASGGMHAQEVYAGVGLFGAQIGYAHALSPSLTLRYDTRPTGTATASQYTQSSIQA
jgi:hypothetical protein